MDNKCFIENKVAIIDNGTGYTKMGWGGNIEPTYDIPTVISDNSDKNSVQVSKNYNEQLDFCIGHDALNQQVKTYPMKSGIVTDWTLMEKFWQKSIFDYLRCDPDETTFVLTEPPMNPPENRENIAEIFFETFNAKSIYIGVQAVLALYSNQMHEQNAQTGNKLTGCVLDSGDGVTHIIPVSDGYVIGSCIKHIPLAGRDITNFIAQMIRDRGEKVNNQDINRISAEIKEKYGYVAPKGLLQEFERYDKPGKDGKPSNKFKQYTFESQVDKKQYTMDVGYERFLGPEMFFYPEFFDSKWRTSIDECIDNAIQGSPIDTRRHLYSNIVLSGGSTMFEGFTDRLQSAIQKRVDDRLLRYSTALSKPQPITVQVAQNPHQRFSVWQGGSLLSIKPGFEKVCKSRQEYLEYGPSIVRQNAVLSSGM
ncbi:hypothetical protein ABPG74_002179 [Tetrahymena malaccensis]